MRWVNHLVGDLQGVRSAFPRVTLDAIEALIGQQETRHDGELRFAVEAALPLGYLWKRVGARARAVELFSQLGVWDTEHNSGVLIYVLLADRRVEIVADRGIHAIVGEKAWESICETMQSCFRDGQFAEGARAGIQAVSDLIAQHFPPRDGNPNELPDRPVVL